VDGAVIEVARTVPRLKQALRFLHDLGLTRTAQEGRFLCRPLRQSRFFANPMPADFAKVPLLDRLYKLRRQGRRIFSSIITAYSFNLPFYENVVLRHLQAAGSRLNVVLVDAGELGRAFVAESTAPRRAGVEPFTDSEGNLSSWPVYRDGQPVQCRDAVARRERMIEKLASLPPVHGALDQIVRLRRSDSVTWRANSRAGLLSLPLISSCQALSISDRRPESS